MYYLDEAWINTGNVTSKVWQDTKSQLHVKPLLKAVPLACVRHQENMGDSSLYMLAVRMDLFQLPVRRPVHERDIETTTGRWMVLALKGGSLRTCHPTLPLKV